MTSAIARMDNGIATYPVERDPILDDEKLWQVVSSGDLRGLTPKQKSDYYLYRCRQAGLEPSNQPLQYMVLNGKEVLYMGKGGADQLRQNHRVSFRNIRFTDDGEYLTYEGEAFTPDGRTDYDIACLFVGTAKGEQRANLKMKCLTKLKRRLTLSITGMNLLDETEVETIPGARLDVQPMVPERQVEAASAYPPANVGFDSSGQPFIDDDIIDAETGEIVVEPMFPPERQPAGASERLTAAQMQHIADLKHGLGWTPEQVRALAGEVTGITNANLLTQAKAAALIAEMETRLDADVRAGLDG